LENDGTKPERARMRPQLALEELEKKQTAEGSS